MIGKGQPGMAGAELSVVLFRDDLRLADNPALSAAVRAPRPILCVFVFDEDSRGIRPLGGAARWWLHQSLAALATELERIGGRLDIVRGVTHDCIAGLIETSAARAVFWNRRYGAAEIALDRALKADLQQRGCLVQNFAGHLLHEPWQVKPKTANFFRVFTPFFKAIRQLEEPSAPIAVPRAIAAAVYPDHGPARLSLDELELLPRRPDWSPGLRAAWRPGEKSARQVLQRFLERGLIGYAGKRDRPDLLHTSLLAPHLRFGEISARQIWHSVTAVREHRPTRDVDKFLCELAWRDFCYHLLYYFPDLPRRNFQRRFDAFRWNDPQRSHLIAWQRGRTGYPIVDAGMRQLWQTGTLPNRLRMIAASFLVKDLLFDWRLGEAWFWDTLVDADLASNSANWQWVAGTGADAAPYFRVFNPVLQGEKFDPNGAYVRRFIPELAVLPAQWIHRPWLAPAPALLKADVRLGQTYPLPIVDHAAARHQALERFAAIKRAAAV
jgi:deoxyribodipyrimidine photo-lyase